jgi:ABC-type cobalamin transport system permease subunit
MTINGKLSPGALLYVSVSSAILWVFLHFKSSTDSASTEQANILNIAVVFGIISLDIMAFSLLVEYGFDLSYFLFLMQG